MRPSCTTVCTSASVGTSCGPSTNRGTTAIRAAALREDAAPITAERTKSIPSDGSGVSALATRPAPVAVSMAWDASSTLRRS